jgi:hypothetical protein
MTGSESPSSKLGHDLLGKDAPTHRCTNCGAAMTLLGRLPSIRIRQSMNVYRCYACDTVVSVPRDES